MAGWISLLVMGLALGGLLRSLWNWFSVRRTESLAQVAYVCAAGYLYVVISRGYLPQVVTLFVFVVAPLFALYYWQARPRPVVQIVAAAQPEPTTLPR
jgi:nicotinamide riboside transporter PnuC